jgi:hypothetical protein
VEATGRDAMAELRNLLGLLNPLDDDGQQPATDATGTSDRTTGGTDGAGVAAGNRADGGAAAAASADAGATDGRSPGAGAATLRPQPRLGELEALVARVSAAGLPVEVQVTGEPWPLPPGVDLAAYRVVQEGLTNVLRHAGPASAAVNVDWGAGLVITVTDDGHGSAQPGEASSGRGLLGLRERLALYGGTLDAGPQPGGGWQLRAMLPESGGAGHD